MRIFGIALLATSSLVGTAWASDKPVIAPAPAWVKPVAPPAVPAKPDESPVRILLSDQQVSLEKGKTTVYTDIVALIQTPQGLSAGNVSLPWRPETDVLTVHKLLIRRGDKVIDVLASGQTFTVVRREQNLESATLDGVLTANIQPEGLQVGDVLQLTVSVSSSDPTLQGHVEQVGAAWNGVPIGRAHLRVQWPNSLPTRFRQSPSLPPLKAIRTGATTAVELSLDTLEPLVAPKGAPARYAFGRRAEFTDFSSWADLGTLMAPLYEKAAVLPDTGPLHAEFERIKAVSSDPKVRAEAALALVQNRVRYVALAMGVGGYVPANVETTWSQRYGDCKGKTALLLALLHAMEIQAEPVAVNAISGDGLDARLPMVGLFNHVLVRATIAGRTYWLDGTRTGDTDLDAIKVPAFGWGLPLVSKGAALVRMLPTPLDTPAWDTTIRIDARSGLTVPVPFKVELVMRGDDAVATDVGLASSVGAARDTALKTFWKGQYDFVEVTSTSATFDPKKREERLVMEGMATMDWSSGWYETDGTGVGYKADFSRVAGPDHDAPFAVAYPYYTHLSETILLPAVFSAANAGLKADVDQTIAGIHYKRHAALDANVFTIDKSERSIAPEFPAKDAVAAQAALRNLASQTVYIRRPAVYTSTDAELKVAMATAPANAEGYVTRGAALLNRQRYDEAIKDFDQANALDSKNVWALANRGLAHVWKEEFPAAAKDLAAAELLDPRNAVIFRARGLLAQRKGDFGAAIAAYSAALEIESNNSFALGHRAEANRSAGNDTAALQDAAAALKIEPQWINLYLLRANIFRHQQRADDAMAEARNLEAANATISYAHVVAAAIYGSFHKDAEMLQSYDRAIAIKPEAYIYIARSFHRPKKDLVARRADIEAALKREPGSTEAIAAKAALLTDSGDLPGAIVIYSTALQKEPGDANLLAHRGIAYARSGDTVRAEKDFAGVRLKLAEASEFNNICWSKATAGVALDSALEECNIALTKAPDTVGYLDSRGLVFLRLGKADAAIADYDRALIKQPGLASSLFGRAVAWARKGNKPKSDADLALALKADPDVQSDFQGYGVKL